eukprot:SAG22_NODE_10520_length_530_cov_0.839907_1_plen_84_part_10
MAAAAAAAAAAPPSAPASASFAITGFSLTAVHVNAWVDWVFVHVETAAGVAGVGELSVGGLATGRGGSCALACLAAIEAALVGR